MPVSFMKGNDIFGKQYLCYHLIVFLEKFLVNFHQFGLAYSCQGLLFGQLLRPFG